MSIAAIAAKTLLEAVRQPRTLALTLGLPVAFMVIFGLAFGTPDIDPPEVAVVDEDGSALSARFVDELRASRLLEVHVLTDVASARASLLAGEYTTLVIVPAGSGERMAAEGAAVRVVGDPSSVEHQVAAKVVSAQAAALSQTLRGTGAALSAQEEPVAARERTLFDHIAPGLMVFAILSIAPQSASALAREVESRTLDRVRASPTGAAMLLAGVALAHLVLAVASLALMLVAARVMGFQNQGSYTLSFAVALFAALAVIGIGMIIAAFVRTQQEAMGLGTLVSVPASFLSGAFFPVPAVVLAGRFELYDALPTRHAVDALRKVMTLGRDAGAVAQDLVALAFLSILLFAAGVGLFRRQRLAVT